MDRIPSLNWLRVFEAAARTGSFTRAAERLNMSRPAVSQQIRALEAHLGRALFARAPAGVALTEDGRGLLAVVGDGLGRIEAEAEAMRRADGPALVLSVSATLLAGWLAPRLPRFLAAHPDIRLDLHSMTGRPETPRRDADLWIGFGPHMPDAEAVSLFGERLVPVARTDMAAGIAGLDGALRHRLLEVADHRANWMQVLGGHPAGARLLHADTTAATLALAAAGAGIALARPPATDALVAAYGLVPCLPDHEIAGVEGYALHRPVAGPQTDPAQAFGRWLVDEARSVSGGTWRPTA